MSHDERGVADVSEKLFSRVTKYHAQIGATVKKDTLNQLEWNLLTEAKEQFHRGEYEMALNTFTACLAVTEKTRNSKDFAVRGAIVHNIASCLHHLGEIEARSLLESQPAPADLRTARLRPTRLRPPLRAGGAGVLRAGDQLVREGEDAGGREAALRRHEQAPRRLCQGAAD
mmetsp:Transcript_25414/g.73237  ORF Transcript_25414/g.73237 Transcript_25414/m.73237 type:complete len:172 (+) Transcript_25414:96-611(+)